MNPESVSRYIRPEDIPLVDDAILEPVLTRVAKEMAASYTDLTVMEWIEALHKALLRGEIVIVIDDKEKRLGLVRTDIPPFAALLQNSSMAARSKGENDDPLGIKGFLGDDH